MKKFWILLLAIMAAAAATAAELPSVVQVKSNGFLKLGPAELSVRCFNDKWATAKWEMDAARIGRQGGSASGTMWFGGDSIRITETITPLEPSGFLFTVNAVFPHPMAINVFCASLDLPTGNGPFDVTVDGRKLDLPEKFTDRYIAGAKEAKELTVVLTGGTTLRFKGNFTLEVQDNRKFGGDRLSLRLCGTPGSGKLSESRIDLAVTVETIRSMPVDISQAVNFGFADDVADDGRGGWSDQGENNDLRSFTQRKVHLENITFNIIDPARNGGKAAIVMGRTVAKRRAAVELPPDTEARAVTLLHASAWTPSGGKPLGYLNVTFADGSFQQIPVSLADDSGNWWNPFPRKNAAVAWKHENPAAPVGLYAAPFALKRGDPRRLEFQLNPEHVNAMWMIAGITLADRPFRFSRADNDVLLASGKEWLPLEFTKEIVAGSPLDFSRYTEAPAGRYGSIIARSDGTLGFEKAPGKRIHLYGANICFSACYLDKAEADKLAADFRKLGYNSLRIHHYDDLLVDPEAPDSVTFDAARLDKLYYLIFTMAKQGIYTTIDLYSARAFKPGDDIPELRLCERAGLKALLPISRAAMNNWKAFSRNLLEHRNPYTGFRWKEDPAIWMLNLVNEEPLSLNWSAAAPLYREKYAQWAKNNGFPARKDDRRFRQFLNELQNKALEEQLRFLRDEIKTKILLTSLNNGAEQADLVRLRHQFDVVDSHGYHDHPTFPEAAWRLPNAYSQTSAIARKAQVPREMMAARIFGKPFVITEFNFVKPNLYRAEGGPLIGAYSALQDWDGLYRFAWSHSRNSVVGINPPTMFDAANDPLVQLSDRIAVLMFRRGDVEAAKEKYAIAVPDDLFDAGRMLSFSETPALLQLGLIARIGSSAGDAPLPGGVFRLPFSATFNPRSTHNGRICGLWEKTVKNGIARSSTGQITLNSGAKTFAVTTPRSESLTLPGGELAGNRMRVYDASTFQTVAALSLDDLPLAESRSILLLQLTNLDNTAAHFGNTEFTLHRAHGHLPMLLRRGAATVAIKSNVPFRVTALKTDGSELGEIKGTFQNGSFVFRADTAGFPGGVMAYHLTR